MAKKKSGEGEMTQFSIRAPTELVNRLESTAKKLATDRAHLLRIILAEKLHEYEERARQADRKEQHR